ncbi:MAG: cupredoxin domain-containing protein [Candidatus Nomurabacteria bacterium]|nr:cupredoxin domain-containing protein [Candidatus Nomurabacteria bacterium]USN88162.1 MAG: cupredoxin domain-containing protein [Candidatus Nomurabacteria bacterium]
MKPIYIVVLGLILIALIFVFINSGNQGSNTTNNHIPAGETDGVTTDNMSEETDVTATTDEESGVMETIETSEGDASKSETMIDPTGKGGSPSSGVTEAAVTEKVFTLDAFSFGYSVTEIKVNKGDRVTINLTNSSGFHDWVVDEFGAATDRIQAGGNTSVTFVADKIGTFEYYCSVGGHRQAGMVGKLIVE